MNAQAFSSFWGTPLRFLAGSWALLLAARAVMLALVWPELGETPVSDLAHALYIGAKFDLRVAVFLFAPLGIVLAIPWLERMLPRLKAWIAGLYGLIFFGLALIYVVDFGFFFYLRQRVDGTLFGLLADTAIAARMVVESYPVGWIALGLALFTAAATAIVWRLLAAHRAIPKLGWKKRTGWTLGLLLLCFLMGYGKISSSLFPLRWSEAYFSTSKDLTLLALNPVQNLYDVWVSPPGTGPDMTAVRDAYPRVAEWLDVPQPDPQTLNFLRRHEGRDGERFNVVIIIMESLAWPKTSLAPGQAEEITPNLAALAKDSAVFPLFFAPARTTARAIFTTITGLPDVIRGVDTSSRNPAVVDQFVLMNEFRGYEKYYMLGGSANWANIRGVLNYNIEGLHLLEEDDWQAPHSDVWGISDLSLFREAAARLSDSAQPFVAVIQTAGFHRPYTIPADNAGFILSHPSAEELARGGFVGEDEYNSLRFSDHALGEFFRLARQEPWFDRTLFAIMGDHGLTDPAPNMPGGYQICMLQDSHVPLLIHAPKLAEKGLFPNGIQPKACGQPDLFPTLARLVGIPFRYTGLGRDLFALDKKANARQFIAGNTENFVRIVADGYCYIYVRDLAEGLYRLDAPEIRNLLDEEPERSSRLHEAARDMFHISKYLLYNNSKAKYAESPADGTTPDHGAKTEDAP